MGKMVACVLIVIVGLLALAVTGFIQIVSVEQQTITPAQRHLSGTLFLYPLQSSV